MPQRDRKALNDEAEQIATLRGASSVDIEFANEDDSGTTSTTSTG
jgi:hypothetical protein